MYPVIRKIFYHALKPCRTKTNPTGSNVTPAPIVVVFCVILWCYATSTSCLWEPPRAVISAQEQERLIGLISVKISSIEIFELSHDFNIEEQKDGQEEQEGLIGMKISSNKIYLVIKVWNISII